MVCLSADTAAKPVEAREAVSPRLEGMPPPGGGPVFAGGNKRGQDTKHGFLSPLDSPYLPLR